MFSENIGKILKFSSKHQIFLEEEEGNEIDIILKRIEREFIERKKFWKEIIISELYSLILLIKRISRRRHIKKKAVTHPLIEKVISYIEKNFWQKITLFKTAEEINCSPYHLSHIFKEYTGMSFKKYLTVYRINEAKKLLEKTQLKVSAIAIKVGFSSFQYLFQKIYRDYSNFLQEILLPQIANFFTISARIL